MQKMVKIFSTFLDLYKVYSGQEVVKAPEPMIRIGPLSVKGNFFYQIKLDFYCNISGSILDDVLSDKKCQLLEDPEILLFLKQHAVKH